MATTTTIPPLNQTGIVGPSPVAPAPLPAPADPKLVTSVAPTKTTDATATNWNVDDKQTVQGQITGIVAADSPLMQQAATAAKQQANQRGLLNSSMAVGAGQGAVYSAAMPIAQQDANTYAQAGKYAADAANAVSTFNAGAKNAAALADNSASLALTQQGNTIAANSSSQAYDAAVKTSMQDAEIRAQASSQAYDAAVKTAMQSADLAGQKELAQLDAEIRQSLGDIEAKYKVQMQSSAAMADTYSSLVNNITSIMQNPDMDAAAKQAAINDVTQLYNNALQTQEAISGMDLGALLTFDSTPTPAPAPAPSPAPTPAPTGNQWMPETSTGP